MARNKGDEIVEGLSELVDVLRSGEPLESRFTVRTYKIAPPPEYHGEGMRRVRELLAMSQAAFAAFLGADASTGAVVGARTCARRASWPAACCPRSRRIRPTARKRLAACLIGPETRGPATQTEARPARAHAPGRREDEVTTTGRRPAGNPHPPGPPCRDLGARPVPRGRVGHRPERRGLQQAEQLGRWLKDADPNGALLLGDAPRRGHGGPDRPRLRPGAGRHPACTRARSAP